MDWPNQPRLLYNLVTEGFMSVVICNMLSPSASIFVDSARILEKMWTFDPEYWSCQEWKYNGNRMLFCYLTSLLYRKMKYNPICENLQGDVIKCYSDNPGRTLNCSQQVREFNHCVEQARTVSILCSCKYLYNLKGSRTGHFVKVSLWYTSLLTNARFRFLYFRISNC